jgi:hypothetical protein
MGAFLIYCSVPLSCLFLCVSFLVLPVIMSSYAPAYAPVPSQAPLYPPGYFSTLPDDPVMREEAIWRDMRALAAKVTIKICGFLDIIITLVLVVFWILDATPFLPPAVLEYAVIYQIPTHVFSGALAIVVSGQRSKELISFEALYSLVTLVLDLWGVITLLIWFIGCLTGSPVTFVADCVLSVLTRFTIMILVFILFVITAVVFWKTLVLLQFTRYMGTSSSIARKQQ